ncbi:MAG: hypothetical protein KGJ79_12640 [Alphaproteobacteria bacterium]|nr:hypothetical protein [Alphaproteobacteria bacterium]MDE2111984.1 hypothetical protein [Alphaproteobacteria bacterium]MDE2492548.1 hypothetical protein [Alphaproteobacteria bacterium]
MTHWVAKTTAFALKVGAELQFHQTVRHRSGMGVTRGDEVEIRFADGTRMSGEVRTASVRGVCIRIGRLIINIRRAPEDLRVARYTNDANLWVITRYEL